MPRVTKKKPLRGSVRQNTSRAQEVESEGLSWFGFWPRLATLVLAAIAILLLAGWAWRSEWPQRQYAWVRQTLLGITQDAGFAVADVTVEGRNFTDKKQLIDALGVASSDPIYGFHPEAAHAAVSALPWTKSVTIIRSLPNKIIVQLDERQPIARWQHNDKTVVIDEDGQELTAAAPEQFANLPLVVGDAAPEQTQALLSDLRAFPNIMRILKAAVRVGERRWNFYLQPNLLVKMPEEDLREGMTKLTELIDQQKILERAVATIDLRIPQKMFIEPGTPAAAPLTGENRE